MLRHIIPRKKRWFLDKGGSNHMSGDKHWLVELDQSFWHLVKLRNDSTMDLIGKGNVKILVEG